MRARATAERTGAGALHFLSAIAETEGAIAFRRADDAVAASQRLDAIVAESFPGWANRAATLRARALLLAGDRPGAQAAVEAGIAATPPGANGLRLRAELDALALAAADTWNAGRAADVADRLLQEGIYVVGFSYPVVPKGQARIRVQMSAAHTRSQLEKAVAAFATVGRELGIIA